MYKGICAGVCFFFFCGFVVLGQLSWAGLGWNFFLIREVPYTERVEVNRAGHIDDTPQPQSSDPDQDQ